MAATETHPDVEPVFETVEKQTGWRHLKPCPGCKRTGWVTRRWDATACSDSCYKRWRRRLAREAATAEAS